MSKSFTPRELHGFRIFGYNVGYFGIFLTQLLISVFAFQFYVYTINLDSILAAIGISINLLITATFSIIFGVLADNKKPGKLGKRRPFLFYGLPIWFISSIFIWLPPFYSPKGDSMFLPTALYFWIILTINAISVSSILSPHASMLPEQSQTHENRKKVASVNTSLMIIASILVMLLPFIVESILEEPENVKWWEPSGKTIIFYMPIIGGIFAIFGLISIMITFFSVDETFHNKIPKNEKKKNTVKEAFEQMIIPAKDKKYKKFLATSFFNNISAKMMAVLIIPFLTYVLHFKGTDFFIYIIISIVCKYAWFYVWKAILKKHDIIIAYSLCIIFSVIASFLELLFLLTFFSFEIEIILFVITVGTVLGTLYGLNLFSTPIASAIIYEKVSDDQKIDIDQAVSKISGSYLGLNSFIISMGQAVGSIILGFILTGPNEENPLIITISMASMGIFFFISFIILKKLKLEGLV
ncbi:MAG: MFS transporter [Candidatus Hermodarchaeota archaeon]